MNFMDYDNDGWPDILQANGAMVDNVQLYHSEVTYKEPLLMFRNVGKGQFEKVSDALGPDFIRPSPDAVWPPRISIMTAISTSPLTFAEIILNFCATTAETPIIGWKFC